MQCDTNEVYNTSKITGMGYINQAGKGYFPDPWCDYASLEMPRTLRNVLQWCEHIWLNNGTFRTACERTVRYFLTQIEIKDVSDQEAKKWREYLNESVNVIDLLANLGDDFMCYGNVFSSLYVPFDRFLICKKCGLERPIQKVDYTFGKNYQFTGTCPKCKHKGIFERRDRRAAEDETLRIIRWDPHSIIIQYNPLSHDVEYRWRIPESFKREIRDGNPFYLRTTHWEFIEAVRDDKLFRFNDKMFHHFKEETLSGIRVMGWGIPRLVSNFKQAYYIQVLKRYNEALALDYIVPFRVLTPSAGSSREADPILHQNLGAYNSKVMNMVAEHRKDPATWHFLPFPINYSSLGGEGATMVPSEMINNALDEMLNAQGVPIDFYKGTMTLQAAPTALRLFQQTWPQLISGFNGWLTWFVQQTARIKNWEPPRVQLQPVTLADDLEKKNILMQLAAGNQISKQTAYAPLGIDVAEETRRIFDEQKETSELERDAQREMSEQQQMEERIATMERGAAGAMPPGGAGMPMGGGMPMGDPAMGGAPMGGAPMGGGGGNNTPQDMLVQAEQIANQLLQMPYEQRKSQMLQLKKSNEALHALVKSKMESIRQQAQSIGGYQILQGGSPG